MVTERIRRGRALGRASLAVLKSHPRLMVFPVIAGVALLALTALVAGPVVAGMARIPDDDAIPTPLLTGAILGAVVWYFGCAFVIVFGNAALISCALATFAGDQPTVAAGFVAAGRRAPQILGWSALAATVGLVFQILDAVSDKINLIGQIIEGLARGAWAVVTYFALPVLVVEGLGPISAVKRSSAILRKTWGESLTGSVGIGLRIGLFALPLFALIAVLASGSGGHSLRVGLGVIAAVYAVALAVVAATLSAILRATLYDYATTGTAPGQMSPELLQSAFVGRAYHPR